MPRSGDGSSHNGPFDEADHSIAHGVGDAATDKVARADKTVPMPGPEKGLAVDRLDASGGQSQGIKRGPDVGQGGGGSSN